MTEVVKVVVSKEFDTALFILEGTEGKLCIPYTYRTWGGTHKDILREFGHEVAEQRLVGLVADTSEYQDDMDSEDATVLYTKELGWIDAVLEGAV